MPLFLFLFFSLSFFSIFIEYLHFFFASVVVALCPNSDEVHIYRKSQDKWERVHVLQKVLWFWAQGGFLLIDNDPQLCDHQLQIFGICLILGISGLFLAYGSGTVFFTIMCLFVYVIILIELFLWVQNLNVLLCLRWKIGKKNCNFMKEDVWTSLF